MCAGEKNRTPIYWLEASHFTTKLRPQMGSYMEVHLHITSSGAGVCEAYSRDPPYNLVTPCEVPRFYHLLSKNSRFSCYTIIMQMIIDIVVAGLMAYLSFTNLLASHIEDWLGQAEPTSEEALIEENTDIEEAEAEQPVSALTKLESIFATIPNILLDSAEYQEATAIKATQMSLPTTTSPTSALVNIYCTFTTDTTIRTTTGTGFFVSEEGVILTNAHVAQFLLLEHTDVLGDSLCTVRSGSPATPLYVAELLYISPAWMNQNANLIDATSPSGTGERDYALLYVTASLNNTKLPERFAALPLFTNALTERAANGTMVAAGYPAGNPDLDTATSLLAKTATTSISELFTFGDNHVDVLALKGSSIGQQGASGGPVINKDGYVIGMIATRGDDKADGTGSLRAISIDHINRTITEETGSSLTTHLSGEIADRANIFNHTITPFLTTLLTNEINN